MTWVTSSPAPRDGHTAPVTVLVAARPEVGSAIYAAVGGDGRFQVLAWATSPEDVRAKLAMRPEAVIADALVFPDAETFASVFAAYQGAVFVLFPADTLPDAVEAARRVAAVKDVHVGEVNYPALLAQVYDAVTSLRAAAVSPATGLFGATGGVPATVAGGWRAVAVWNPQGGVGKSTVAAALAMEAAGRGISTLLVGLGAPDPIPLTLGLKPQPNITVWAENPTPETLRGCVQKVQTLDVLTGFPDGVSRDLYAPKALEGPASLLSLATAAAYAGYAAVVFDVSSQELAPAALAAANTLVLVAEPTLPGIMNAIEAMHLVEDVMAGQHSIAAERMFLVVNRVRPGSLKPDEVLNTGRSHRRRFPALVAAIPEDAAVLEAANNRTPPYTRSDALRKATRALADVVFGRNGSREEGKTRKPRAFSIGGIRLGLRR